MLIGDRLRNLRKFKNLSQSDIEQRSGLLRAYVSRVENGYTIPSLSTLERFAKALGLPLYLLFLDGSATYPLDTLPEGKSTKTRSAAQCSGKEALALKKLSRLLARMGDSNRELLLYMAQKMTTRRVRSRRAESVEARRSTFGHPGAL
jgi:transcriptional regulator with XRE-family HTH domain